MKQLKEPKAMEKEAKKTARVTSEKAEPERIGELLISSIKTKRTCCTAQQDSDRIIISFGFISW